MLPIKLIETILKKKGYTSMANKEEKTKEKKTLVFSKNIPEKAGWYLMRAKETITYQSRSTYKKRQMTVPKGSCFPASVSKFSRGKFSIKPVNSATPSEQILSVCYTDQWMNDLPWKNLEIGNLPISQEVLELYTNTEPEVPAIQETDVPKQVDVLF